MTKGKNQKGKILEENNRIMDYLLNTKEPYILEIDNMKIEMIYSKDNKSFNECMLNILKQKMQS